jgi:hypothetical protein
MIRFVIRPLQLLSIACIAVMGVLMLAALPSAALAQYPNDPPALSVGATARAGIELNITAGPSGAPDGFTVWWMKQSDFIANGSQWSPGGSTNQLESCFMTAPTLHTMNGTLASFHLSPGQTIQTEIGDLFDETGIETNSPDELEPGVAYVFCVFACTGTGLPATPTSEYSTTIAASTNPHGVCVFTIGYWKNHAGLWPVMSLTLGTVSYTQAQLLAILGTPAQGNGLLILAHQLIATKLNILNGGDPGVVSATVTAADALIGGLMVPPVGSGYLAPASVSALTQILDDYNNGLLATEHCVTAAQTPTWGRIKGLYR